MRVRGHQALEVLPGRYFLMKYRHHVVLQKREITPRFFFWRFSYFSSGRILLPVLALSTQAVITTPYGLEILQHNKYNR